MIVSAEERETFARFLVSLPEEKAAALALANPAPPNETEVLEIALLRIDDLQVDPLDSTTRQ